MTTESTSVLFSHSHHLLSVKGEEFTPDVLAFEGHEALSTPFSYRIEFTCPEKQLSREAVLMHAASLTLQAPVNRMVRRLAQQPLRTLYGVVTGFEHLATSRDEALYALTLRPRLALLSRSHQNTIYQDMSVPQIVESILRQRHGMRGQDFLFSLSREYPRREQVMQYGEDDLRFITRLLGEAGIWFRFMPDTRLKIDVVEFYDSRQGYERGAVLPAVPLSGLHDGEQSSVRQLTSEAQVVEQRVTTRDYNYRQAVEDMDLHTSLSRDDSTTSGEAYHYGDNYLTAGSVYDSAPAAESGIFYARLRHERYLNRQTRLSGVSCSATLSPGQVLQVTGGEAVTELFRKGVFITETRSSARRDSSFEVRFNGIPDTVDYCFRPEPPARPVMAGTLAARVTATPGFEHYGHIDRDGRYRVVMLFDRTQWEAGYESLWVRQARQYAGDTFGLHLPLLAGTEVAIAFEHGDPDRPYIAGALHDSAHPDHVTIHNYRRNVLRTPGNNKLRLDDTRGKEHIKLSTEYGGKSQLNLGHLVDSEKQPRGEGFELRTDEWGALRAQKGLLITADPQPKAQGVQLEMAAALQELAAARKVTEGLIHAAQAAQAELADITEQTTLMQHTLEQLKQQAILISAPAGIAQVTPANLQLSAGENMITTVGKSANFSIVKKFTLAAGEVLSFFAHKMGIKLFAARGKVDIQAQSDGLNLFAQQQLSIASAENRVMVTAKQEIVLNAGGAFIKLSEAGVEIGTNKNVTMKCIAVQQLAAAEMNTSLTLPTGCKPDVIVAAQQQSAIVSLD